MSSAVESPATAFVRAPMLTVREAQVLDAWLNSSSKAQAAAALQLSENTVRAHIRRIRAKYAGLGYDVSSKGQLIERAILDGLL